MSVFGYPWYGRMMWREEVTFIEGFACLTKYLIIFRLIEVGFIQSALELIKSFMTRNNRQYDGCN